MRLIKPNKTIELLEELNNLESFTPETFDDYETNKSMDLMIKYISNKISARNFLEENLFDTIIEDYNNNYLQYSRAFLINELYNIYQDCRDLILNEKDYDNIEEIYNDDKNFENNGFVKSDFVIHEHESRTAPLHWDLRWKNEFKTLAYSFVLLKHKMPDDDNPRLLCKQQPMHPITWVDLDHTSVKEGYGAGSVKTIDRGTIYYKIKNNSFSFYLKGDIYQGAYHLVNLNKNLYLLFKAEGSIIPNEQERLHEWNKYARNFIIYLSKEFPKIFGEYYKGINLVFDDSSFEAETYESAFGNQTTDEIIIKAPSIDTCIKYKNEGEFTMSTGKRVGHKKSLINSVEDIMRAFILRNLSWRLFDRIVAHINDPNINIYDEIYEKTKHVDYYKFGYEELKDEKLHKKLRLVNMFSAIFMGHRFYGSFDMKSFLISYFQKLKDRQNNRR